MFRLFVNAKAVEEYAQQRVTLLRNVWRFLTNLLESAPHSHQPIPVPE